MLGVVLVALLGQSASDLVDEARALLGRRAFGEAEAVLERANDENPGSPRVLYYLGLSRIRLGKMGSGIEALERADALSPMPNPGVLFELGSAYIQLARYPAAEHILTRARDLTPDEVPIRLQLGWTYYQLVEGEKAAIEFRKALELDPRNATAHLYLGLAEAALGELERAEVSFRRALELSPAVVEAKLGLARVLSQSGRRAEAATILEAVVAELPERASPAYTELGLIALGDGDTARAIEYFAAVVDLDPEHRQATYNLWLLYRRLGRLDEAEVMRARLESLPDGGDSERSLSRTSSKKRD